MKIGIATAKIDLEQKMSRFKRYKFWVWNIIFSDASSTRFSNLLVELPEDKKEAKKRKKEIKDIFKKIGIKNDSTAILLFNRETHDIIYIGSPEKKLWISVKDDYALEEKLELNITSLKAYIY